jgi:hypothetical protein
MDEILRKMLYLSSGSRVAQDSCAVAGMNYTLAQGHARLLEVIGELDETR